MLANKNTVGAHGNFFIRIFGTVIAQERVNWLTSVFF